VLASWLIASGYAPTAVIERDNITRRGLARLLREHRVSEVKISIGQMRPTFEVAGVGGAATGPGGAPSDVPAPAIDVLKV
jgi:hypothetical protein